MPKMIANRITWALLLAGLLLTMPGARAHAFLDHASPAVGSTVQHPPATVSLWFSEELEPAFGTITVTDQAGRRVDGGDARIDAADKTVLHASLKPLAPGTYSAQWRVVSVDSHSTEGSFDFSRGWLTTPDPLAWTRTVHFASTIQLAGIFGSLFFVAEPVFRRAPATQLPAVCKLRIQLVRLAWISLAASIASGGLWLVLVAAEMSGEPLRHVLSTGLLATVVAGTQFGRDWELRLVLTVVLGCCLALLRLNGRGALGAVGRTGALLCSAAELATLAWAGHAAGTKGLPGDIHRAGDVIHLLAAGAWLGGLLPLALLYSHARRARDPAWAAIARGATLRFSALGIVSVAALLITGIVNAWFLVGSIPKLVGTVYGRVLLVKVGLFTAMVGIAANNRFRLTLRLVERANDGTKPGMAVCHL